MQGRLKTIGESLKRVISSNKFFWGVIILFIIQGLFLTVALNQPQSSDRNTENYLFRTTGVVPDGNRHMAGIYHFAKQPLLDGPWVQDMTADELMMGDLVRFPSYFYYYLLSFPVRAALVVGMSDQAIITLVRVIGLVFGVLALYVFSRIVRRVTSSKVIKNISVLMLSMTGSFVYLAPAENYDMLALLLWFLYLLATIRLVVDRDLGQIYWMLVWFGLLCVTKYTYIPFMGVTGLMAIGYMVYQKAVTKEWLKSEGSRLKSFVSDNKFKAILLAILMTVSATLSIERIGINLIEYQSFSPRCDRVHDREDCMRFGVFNRNANRLDSIERGDANTRDYVFTDYTSMWIARYYSTLFYYQGHQNVSDIRPAIVVGGVISLMTILMLAIGLFIKRQVPYRRKVEWYLLLVAGTYVVGQYLYNVMIFLTYQGQTYGHQGRYLLPAVGLIYVLVLLAMYRLYLSVSKRTRVWLLWVYILLAIVFIYTNSAAINFFYHAQDVAWYSDLFQELFFR